MKLKLKKNYYIETDSYNYVVKQYHNKFDKQDKQLYTTHGQFQTLQGALKKWLSMNIKETGDVTAAELMEQLQVIENKIDKLEVE